MGAPFFNRRGASTPLRGVECSVAQPNPICLTLCRQDTTSPWSTDYGGCKDNTSNDPFSRCKSVQKLATEKNWRSQNTVWLQVQKWTTNSRRKEICTWYYVCVVKPSTIPMTTWPPRPRTPSTQRTWTLTRECAVLLFVSQVRVVMIHTLHRMAQGVAHVISSMHEVCGSPSTLSPPFPSTSPSSHSSFDTCTSSCTSSTTLRAAASLCTPPQRVWTLLTTPTSSQVVSQTPTTSRRLTSSPTQNPWPLPTVFQARVPRGRRVRWHRTRGYASRSTPSTCLSLPARRLVCRSVVHVRANVATCWRANGATRCGKMSRTEHWTHRLGLFLDRQREQILAECQAEIKKHEFQADYDRRSVRKLGEIVESQQEELHCAQAEERPPYSSQWKSSRIRQQFDR